MFCNNCGKLIKDGDKFCSNCGEKVEISPDFGFAKEPSSLVKESEKQKKTFHMEEFNWNLDGYPTDHTKPTDDIDFNWQSVVEEKQRRAFADRLEPKSEPKEAQVTESDFASEKSLEEEIFADISQVYSDEPTKIIEKDAKDDRVDKFYTYNKKNAAFQALLDQEYEKIQNGEEEEDEVIAFEPLFKTELQPELPDVVPEAEEIQEEPEVTEAPLEYVGVALAQTPESVIAEEEPAIVEPVVEVQKAQLEEEPAREEVEVSEETVVDEFPSEEEANRPPSTQGEKETQEEKSYSKLTFDDVFSDDDDDDDDEEKPKKKGKALKIIAIVLCVLIAIELVIIGIMYFGKGTPLADKLNDGYLYIVNLVSGEDKDKPSDNGEPVAVESEIAKIIKTQSMYNKNIGTVEENIKLIFDIKKDYDINEMKDTFAFSNSKWYTDDENNPVYYGDEIIGTIIKYFSSWVDMANGTDQVVLDYIDDTSQLYEDIEEFENKEDVKYGINKLEIGEIRNGSRGFYIMTTATKVDSKTKKETVENSIVYMEPINKTMKILNNYKF